MLDPEVLCKRLKKHQAFKNKRGWGLTLFQASGLNAVACYIFIRGHF